MIWVAKNLYFFNCLLDGAHTNDLKSLMRQPLLILFMTLMLHICQLWMPLLGLCSSGSFQREHDDTGNDDGATDKRSHVRDFPQHDKTDDGRDQRIDEHVVGHFAGAVCNSDRLASALGNTLR